MSTIHVHPASTPTGNYTSIGPSSTPSSFHHSNDIGTCNDYSANDNSIDEYENNDEVSEYGGNDTQQNMLLDDYDGHDDDYDNNVDNDDTVSEYGDKPISIFNSNHTSVTIPVNDLYSSIHNRSGNSIMLSSSEDEYNEDEKYHFSTSDDEAQQQQHHNTEQHKQQACTLLQTVSIEHQENVIDDVNKGNDETINDFISENSNHMENSGKKLDNTRNVLDIIDDAAIDTNTYDNDNDNAEQGEIETLEEKEFVYDNKNEQDVNEYDDSEGDSDCGSCYSDGTGGAVVENWIGDTYTSSQQPTIGDGYQESDINEQQQQQQQSESDTVWVSDTATDIATSEESVTGNTTMMIEVTEDDYGIFVDNSHDNERNDNHIIDDGSCTESSIEYLDVIPEEEEGEDSSSDEEDDDDCEGIGSYYVNDQNSVAYSMQILDTPHQPFYTQVMNAIEDNKSSRTSNDVTTGTTTTASNNKVLLSLFQPTSPNTTIVSENMNYQWTSTTISSPITKNLSKSTVTTKVSSPTSTREFPTPSVKTDSSRVLEPLSQQSLQQPTVGQCERQGIMVQPVHTEHSIHPNDIALKGTKDVTDDEIASFGTITTGSLTNSDESKVSISTSATTTSDPVGHIDTSLDEVVPPKAQDLNVPVYEEEQTPTLLSYNNDEKDTKANSTEIVTDVEIRGTPMTQCGVTERQQSKVNTTPDIDRHRVMKQTKDTVADTNNNCQQDSERLPNKDTTALRKVVYSGRCGYYENRINSTNNRRLIEDDHSSISSIDNAINESLEKICKSPPPLSSTKLSTRKLYTIPRIQDIQGEKQEAALMTNDSQSTKSSSYVGKRTNTQNNETSVEPTIEVIASTTTSMVTRSEQQVEYDVKRTSPKNCDIRKNDDEASGMKNGITRSNESLFTRLRRQNYDLDGLDQIIDSSNVYSKQDHSNDKKKPKSITSPHLDRTNPRSEKGRNAQQQQQHHQRENGEQIRYSTSIASKTKIREIQEEKEQDLNNSLDTLNFDPKIVETTKHLNNTVGYGSKKSMIDHEGKKSTIIQLVEKLRNQPRMLEQQQRTGVETTEKPEMSSQKQRQIDLRKREDELRKKLQDTLRKHREEDSTNRLYENEQRKARDREIELLQELTRQTDESIQKERDNRLHNFVARKSAPSSQLPVSLPRSMSRRTSIDSSSLYSSSQQQQIERNDQNRFMNSIDRHQMSRRASETGSTRRLQPRRASDIGVGSSHSQNEWNNQPYKNTNTIDHRFHSSTMNHPDKISHQYSHPSNYSMPNPSMYPNYGQYNPNEYHQPVSDMYMNQHSGGYNLGPPQYQQYHPNMYPHLQNGTHPAYMTPNPVMEQQQQQHVYGSNGGGGSRYLQDTYGTNVQGPNRFASRSQLPPQSTDRKSNNRQYDYQDHDQHRERQLQQQYQQQLQPQPQGTQSRRQSVDSVCTFFSDTEEQSVAQHSFGHGTAGRSKRDIRDMRKLSIAMDDFFRMHDSIVQDSRRNGNINSNNRNSRNMDLNGCTTQIEICPGVFERLRSADETSIAFDENNIAYPTCIICNIDLACIADSEYVLCPICKVVSPAITSTGTKRRGGGIGLGIRASSLR